MPQFTVDQHFKEAILKGDGIAADAATASATEQDGGVVMSYCQVLWIGHA